MFDAAQVFRANGAFDLRRISKIVKSGSGIVAALEPLVAYEDNHLLVIFKPAGWLSQKDASGDLSVNEIFAAYLKEKYHKPGNVFCAAVQRLDRPAAGLMAIARTSKAAARLSAAIRERHFEKRYHILTHRPLNAAGVGSQKIVLMANMVKTGRSVHRADVPHNARAKANSVPYMLSARLVRAVDNFFQYEVQIETGKFHQIRALCAANGAPILGDVKYGGIKLKKHDDRIALVASQIKFRHPTQEKDQLCYLHDSSLEKLESYFI
ncbi:MAG: RNA pseudouridine synthase [Spirochaetes bacterium]|nr:RNA pseudouridine synthase [Spirochaetota bacterium]